jgi:elongation factor Ts
VAFAREIAMHVAASPTTKYVTEDEVPQEEKDKEIRVFEQQAEADGKPEQIRQKIAQGRLNKWLEEVVLLKQPHVNQDKHDSKTIEQLRGDLSAKTGENVVIRRFTRFAVGE